MSDIIRVVAGKWLLVYVSDILEWEHNQHSYIYWYIENGVNGVKGLWESSISEIQHTSYVEIYGDRLIRLINIKRSE